MKTIKEIAMELLLNGEHLDKGEFHDRYHTFTLTQRIEEIRRLDKWDVKSKTIPGRKGMVEYWLEPQEIDRIKNTQSVAKTERNVSDEQLVDEKEKVAETSQKTAQNEVYEQIGLGLLGGHNYRG